MDLIILPELGREEFRRALQPLLQFGMDLAKTRVYRFRPPEQR